MGVLGPTFKDLQAHLRTYMGGARNHTFDKDFKVTKAGSIYSNPGATGPMRDYFTLTTNQKEMDKLIRPVFQQYKSRHPYVPPKDIALKKIYDMKWMNRVADYIRNNQKKDKPMNWASIYGIPEDSHLRHGAKPASTWVKKIRVVGNDVFIDLGGKEYQYGITNSKAFQRFLQQPSLGAVIAKLSRMPGGSYGGLTLKPSLRKH